MKEFLRQQKLKNNTEYEKGNRKQMYSDYKSIYENFKYFLGFNNYYWTEKNHNVFLV